VSVEPKETVEQLHARRKRRRRWRRLILATIVLLPIVYVTVMAIFASRPQPNTSGYPETLEELQAWIEDVPPQENAAPVYQKAFGLYSKDDFDGWARKECYRALNADEPLPEEPRAMLEEHLKANQAAIDALYEASRYAQCSFPITLASEMELHHLRWLRTGRDLLWWKCLLSAMDGDSEEVSKALLATLAIGRSVRNEPLLSSQYMRDGVLRSAVESLKYALSRVCFSDDALADIQDALADAECRECMTRAYAAERCTRLLLFDDSQAKLFGGNAIPAKIYKWSGVRAHDREIYDSALLRLIEISKLPFPEALPKMDKLVEDVTQEIDWKTPFAGMFLLQLQGSIMNEALLAADIRLANVALAVERYRLAKGAVPESLSVLVPEYLTEIPEDPFDGNKLRYNITDTGYTIYSIGPDRTDNNGEPRKGTAGDVVFSVKRPSPRD